MKIIPDKYITPNIKDYDVVLYGMGINNSMYKGFANEIALNFPKVRELENATMYGAISKYGTVHCVKDSGIIFAACYCNNGGYKKKDDSSFIDYDHLKKCLTIVADNFHDKRICSPLIGYSKYDGNGDYDAILNIYKDIFKNIDIDIYPHYEYDFKEYIYHEVSKLAYKRKSGEMTMDEYIRERSKLEWKRKNGIFVKMPENYNYKEDNKKKKTI